MRTWNGSPLFFRVEYFLRSLGSLLSFSSSLYLCSMGPVSRKRALPSFSIRSTSCLTDKWSVGMTTVSAATRTIGEELTFFDPTYPAVNGGEMRLGNHGNGARVDALQAQGDHEGAAFNFLLDEDATDVE